MKKKTALHSVYANLPATEPHEGHPVAERPYAVESIRRGRGGTQPILMRCSDGNYYYVKYLNNPQGRRALANDYLGTLLARALGLPVATPSIILVKQKLIDICSDLYIDTGSCREACVAGECFGSLVAVSNVVAWLWPQISDDIPDSAMAFIGNQESFLGMFVFDVWAANTDVRQVVYERRDRSEPFQVKMIDQGLCFGGVSWSCEHRIYVPRILRAVMAQNNWGFDSFIPWIERLENFLTLPMIIKLAEELPIEWYEGDSKALSALTQRLDERRLDVRRVVQRIPWDLIRQAYPNSLNGLLRRLNSAKPPAEARELRRG